MAPQLPQHGAASDSAGAAGYKRASRARAPKRFVCTFQGCDKIYSRAEHLQRHQLNHNPKEIFRCDFDGCEQKFVRSDLLERHKKRHGSTSYIPRNRVPSFGTKDPVSPGAGADNGIMSSTGTMGRTGSIGSVPRDATILLSPDSAVHPAPALPPSAPSRLSQPDVAHPPHLHPAWMPSPTDMVNIIRPKQGFFPSPRDGAPPSLPSPHVLGDHQPAVGSLMAFSSMHTGAPFQPNTADVDAARENFAVWLFDPATQYPDGLGIAQGLVPFLEGGLESAFNSQIHYDYESLTSGGRSALETPPRSLENNEDVLSEYRHQDILHWFRSFRERQPQSEPLLQNLVRDSGGDWPALNMGMMRDCLQEYWDHVSPRLPIVHQPTFSCNRCSVFLLIAMIALGAASFRGRDSTGRYPDHGVFADVMIWSVRWEIMTSEEALPPVSLWVAQALCLVEFYEKMYSSRRFHERANIHHSVIIALLRRGSPLIGRSGSDSPPEEAPTLDARASWLRWADTEAMHRVVYAAFMIDVIHAAMFGHVSDMGPHEIRLPLPCDDNLWGASSPDLARQFDQNLRMYGMKTPMFLDGLKSALHGKEVQTHSFGRMIILSGLLSVGWHLSHRETHTKWLDLTKPSAETQDNWEKILLKAFDDWKVSFDAAQGSANSPTSADPTSLRTSSNGPIQSAAVLFHLAHISLHVDIVDCQVYAGAKRLLGRKVSSRDYANVVSRLRVWAKLSSTRHAVLHAFRLLHRVLVDPRRNFERKRQATGDMNSARTLPPIEAQTYSCRNESDPHRPWIMYYAALCIWSFVRAISQRHDSLSSDPNAQMVQQPKSSRSLAKPALPAGCYRRVVTYLSNVATLPELTEQMAKNLQEGLPDLLDTLHVIFSEARVELLLEASERLRVCREILVGPSG